MTKTTIDYSRSCVYRIAWKDVTYYVGSTTNFTQRKCQHKSSCKDKRNDRQVYKFIRDNGGWTDEWCMVLVNEYPNCKSANELRRYERDAYDFYKPELNVLKPVLRDDEREILKETTFQCKNCNKTYESNQGLWSHNKVCKSTILKQKELTETELHMKLDNFAVLLLEIARNQQSDLSKKYMNSSDVVDNITDGHGEVKKSYTCVPCGCLFGSRSNLTKHFTSNKHIDKIRNPFAIVVDDFKCPMCAKIYKSNQGLWSHKNICKKSEPVIATEPTETTHIKLDYLERILVEMAARTRSHIQ
jgi:GIY-YIG catalytic domain